MYSFHKNVRALPRCFRSRLFWTVKSSACTGFHNTIYEIDKVADNDLQINHHRTLKVILGHQLCRRLDSNKERLLDQ